MQPIGPCARTSNAFTPCLRLSRMGEGSDIHVGDVRIAEIAVPARVRTLGRTADDAHHLPAEPGALRAPFLRGHATAVAALAVEPSENANVPAKRKPPRGQTLGSNTPAGL